MSAPSVEELRAAPCRRLRQLMEAGHPIDPTLLDDRAYAGVSLGIPHWVERFAWTTFVKTFHREPETGVLRGWNVRVEQTGLHGAVRYKSTSEGRPMAWGFFEVVAPRDHGAPSGLDHGLLIHYGLGGNGPMDPISRIRDPLVALTPGDTSYLLGASYAAVGMRLMTPSYFLLHRPSELDHVAHP